MSPRFAPLVEQWAVDKLCRGILINKSGNLWLQPENWQKVFFFNLAFETWTISNMKIKALLEDFKFSKLPSAFYPARIRVQSALSCGEKELIPEFSP